VLTEKQTNRKKLSHDAENNTVVATADSNYDAIIKLFFVHCRAGSRVPVTYTLRTRFGLAIVRCVRQVDSQSGSSSPQTTRLANMRKTKPAHKPIAKLANCKLTSASFGIAAYTYILTYLLIPRLHEEEYIKHAYTIYTVIKPALRVHDVC